MSHDILNRLIKQLVLRTYRIIVLVVGLTVLLAGIIMIVTPGPAIVVIPLGLTILGTEFVWARRLLLKLKERVASLRGKEEKKEEKDENTPKT